MPLPAANPELAARLIHSIREATAPVPEPALPDVATLRRVLAEAKQAHETAELDAKAARAAVAVQERLLATVDEDLRATQQYNNELAAKQKAAYSEWAEKGGIGDPPPYGPVMPTAEREHRVKEIAERRGAIAGSLQELRLKAAAAETAPALLAARAAHVLAAGAVLAADTEHLAFGEGGQRDLERHAQRGRIRIMSRVAALCQGAGDMLVSPRLRKFADDRPAFAYVSGDDPKRRAEVQAQLDRLMADPDAELGD